MAREYVFVDEWDVDAPQEAVFDALADAHTYPEWWSAVYLKVEGDRTLGVGAVTRHEFKGRLPYHLKTSSEIVAMDRPNSFDVSVVGDLTGHGAWTLTAGDRGIRVRFDWRVIADRPLLRILTPVLRPLFRWNHNWSIERAIEGLEPHARAAAGIPAK